MLNDSYKPIRLSLETVVRTGLISTYHLQLGNGAASRSIMNSFSEGVKHQLERSSSRLATNKAGPHFWKIDLADRDDTLFRDARERSFNIEYKRKQKADEKAKRIRFRMDERMEEATTF